MCVGMGEQSHSSNLKALYHYCNFCIKAKVLAKENYYTGREADLSPTDLALGWGNMSDESILQTIEISQSRRFYYWHVNSFPIPRHEIETHSANMHLIPANDSVKSVIGKIRNGDIIELSGSLVNVISNDDDWQWKSSQTRNDTGKVFEVKSHGSVMTKIMLRDACKLRHNTLVYKL